MCNVCSTCRAEGQMKREREIYLPLYRCGIELASLCIGFHQGLATPGCLLALLWEWRGWLECAS